MDGNKDYNPINEFASTDTRQKKEVFVPEEAPKISPMVIVRAIVLLVAIINSTALTLGFDLNLQVDQALIYEGVSGLFLVGAAFFAWKKDNDYSKKARKRKEIIDQVEGKK